MQAKPVRLALLALALVVVPTGSLAAVVKGKTQGGNKLLNASWNESKDPKLQRYTFREPSATVRADVHVLSAFLPKELCIAAMSDDAKPDTVHPMRVVVAGGRTSPVTLVVAPGQTIQFDNQDPFDHTLFDPKGALKPTQIGKAKTSKWTPPGPGKYEIRDKATPSLRSWIVVEAKTAAVGYPLNRAGDFAIELEPGHYTLRGYFQGAPVGKELEVDVRPKPNEQELKNPLVVSEGGNDKNEKSKDKD